MNFIDEAPCDGPSILVLLGEMAHFFGGLINLSLSSSEPIDEWLQGP
jgi:hypothetical protein